jgi:hypothetical protein
MAQYLWNDNNKPKKEDAISDLVKYHLETHLKNRGIVVNREVEIHKYDKTDLLITAEIQNSSSQLHDCVKVIIEVKRSTNRGLRNAMKTQLAGRYLTNSDCRHGLYLVGCFSKLKQSRLKLEKYLTRQAKALSKDGLTIKAKVIDCTMRRAAVKKTSSRRTKTKP